MGYLLHGEWRHGEWPGTGPGANGGVPQHRFRDRVSADGESGRPAMPGRYRLHVSLACPWSQRTLIVRSLKKLHDVVPISLAHPVAGPAGWTFPGVPSDTYLHRIYSRSRADYSGPVTLPVLVDTADERILNNDSGDIMRMLNSEFDAFTDVRTDFYPEALRPEIDRIDALVDDSLNQAIHDCGFATSQADYDRAFARVFAVLAELERVLGRSRYLAGDRPTEADWRLFVTLLRFDAVYFGLFNCNLHRVADYRNLSHYLRELFQLPGVSETVDFDQIKQHYYRSYPEINPRGIVPGGPATDFDTPHDRQRFWALHGDPQSEEGGFW